MSLEIHKGYNKNGEHTYNYVEMQDVVNAIKDGTITFDLPHYPEREGEYSYNERYKDRVVMYMESRIERMSKKSKEEQERLIHRVRIDSDALDEDIQAFEKKGIDGKDMIWIDVSTMYQDVVTGDTQGWLYLNIKTNSIALYHFDTKEKYVTQDRVFPNGKKITIDVPSGKLVFGYYDVFEPFDKEADWEIADEYFDSEQGKKRFFDYHQKNNIAMWYDGGFSINTHSDDEYDFRFADSCNDDYGTKIADIEHDKCTCLVDLDTLLAKTKGTDFTFTNYDGDELPFTKKNMMKESKVKSDYKGLQVIDVPKGKYEITIVDYKDRTEVYEDDCPEDMIGYGDYLRYTLYGGMKLIEKY
jgi:hypothetical protein